MNTLTTLKQIREEIARSGQWLDEHFANPTTLSHISMRVQALAKKLGEIEAANLKDLEQNGPQIFGEQDNMTFTLLRDGKAKHIQIGKYHLQISRTNEKYICDKLMLNGASDTDGFIHYIYMTDYGEAEYGIWLSKKEAAILKEKLWKLDNEDDSYRQDSKCTFCGSMVSECGEDHADEMRQNARESMRGHYDD